MNRILKSIINIRKEEVGITLLAVANYYLLLVAYYLLKPARDSLFLVKVSAEQLPLVFIMVALVTVPVLTAYSRASRSLSVGRLINISLGLIAVLLLGMRFLITQEGAAYFYIFYAFVSIYGALTTSQFWLLANAVFTSTQAKRIFPTINMAGILGALTGGALTRLIVQTFNVATEDLLFVSMGIVFISMVIVARIVKVGRVSPELKQDRHKRKEKPAGGYRDLFSTVTRSRHLMLVVGIVAMTMMVASFVDYQFKVISKEAYPEKEDLTAFFGMFYGGLSLMSLALQFVFTGTFLRILGVGGVILFLPVGLLLGSGTMFLMPGLLAGVLLRGTDGVLKYSVDKTARELLFLPIPISVKKKTKAFIDIFVDRWFRGIAGALLLLCTLVLHMSIRQISIVVMVFIGIWLVLALKMRKEYVNTFRKALERREIDLSEIRVDVNEASTMGHLISALESSNERQILYALEMLRSVEHPKLPEALVRLLAHESPEIRQKSLIALRGQSKASFPELVNDLLSDPDADVRREAVAFICERGSGDPLESLKGFLNHQDSNLQLAAFECIADHGDEQSRSLIRQETLREFMGEAENASVETRGRMAHTLGALSREEFHGDLLSLLNDPSPSVVRAAIEAAGRSRDREYVPELIRRLGDRQYRSEARKALAAYGHGVLGTLSDWLEDASVDYSIRESIPRVMGDIPDQDAVDLLTSRVRELDPRLRFGVIQALNRLRKRYENLRFDPKSIENSILAEAEEYYEFLELSQTRGDRESQSHKLLFRAVEEKLDRNLERIFRLLGLCYPPRDIYSAYLGLKNDERSVRASAIEFLDNVLKGPVKKAVFPIVDDVPVSEVIRTGRSLYDLHDRDWHDKLKELGKSRDPWIRSCAVYCMGVEKVSDYEPIIREAARDSDPMVSETGELALRLVKAG